MTTDQKLTYFRKHSGLSQEKLAEQLDVSRQTISRWETGACLPSSENLAKLSELYQVPMETWVRPDWIPSEETVPTVKVIEIPTEVLVPVEVPVSRPKRRLLFLLAALILGVGFLIGVLLFWEPNPTSESVLINTLGGEVLEESIMNESIGLIDP